MTLVDPFRAWRPNDLPLADEAAYWQQFPLPGAGFHEHVRTTGIHFCCALYDIGTYASDFQGTDRVEAVRAKLPKPPEGYFWTAITGGLMISGMRFFRLWHHDFGYVPMSE